MSALATPSRVRILGRLREERAPSGSSRSPSGWNSRPSPQLRILRDLGLVEGSRNGRHVIYGLYDSHVATLLEEALRHIEHLRAACDPPPQAIDHEATSEGAT